ncbi:Zn-dependent exopeptidase [Ramicandelaber brevisporus]|nr:Zn-dependent exopeptidase [Ramicandelaber brevisporus]
MRFNLIFAAAALLAATTTTIDAAKARYDGHVLIRVKTSSAALHDELANHDIWSHTRDGINVHVSPSELVHLQQKYGESFKYEVVSANIQSLIDQDEASIAKSARKLTPFSAVASTVAAEDSADAVDGVFGAAAWNLNTTGWHTTYHPYADIKLFYQNLACKYSNLVKYIPSIGKTIEGRNIFAIEITSPVRPAGGKKSAFFQFNIHAREWISGALGQFFSEQLASNYNKDARVKNILDKVSISIVGVANPDGYIYSMNTERLWRKNRRFNGVVNGTDSYGVDLNRNWKMGWGLAGGSNETEAENYYGNGPASEPETRALQGYFDKLPQKLLGIDLHSCGQLVIYPYAYTGERPPAQDLAKYTEVIDKMIATIAKPRGTQFVRFNIYNDAYPSAGGATDYFYGRYPNGTMFPGRDKVAYGLAMELQPLITVPMCFALNTTEITPVGQENVPAFYDLIEYALQNPLQ